MELSLEQNMAMVHIHMIYTQYVNRTEDNICKDFFSRVGETIDKEEDPMGFYSPIQFPEYLDDIGKRELNDLRNFQKECKDAMNNGEHFKFLDLVQDNCVEAY